MAQTPVMRRSAAAFLAGSRRAAVIPASRTPVLARTYAAFSRRAIDRETSKMIRSGPKEPTMSTGYKEAALSMFKDGGSPLFPATFVAVPFSRYPRQPVDFLRYHWYRTLAFLGGKLTVFGNRLESMPGWTSSPRYRPRTRQIATTAKAMYREVLEAFAAGETETIEKLCVPSYASRLTAAISRRDPKEQVHFEIVKYHQPWRFPQLKSHQIRAANEFDQDQLTEQAVVAISSTQRVTKTAKAIGRVIPDSTKIQEKIEYVVLSRNVDKKTWEIGSWKIWGTTSDTPLDKYLADMASTDEKQQKHLGFKKKKQK